MKAEHNGRNEGIKEESEKEEDEIGDKDKERS